VTVGKQNKNSLTREIRFQMLL